MLLERLSNSHFITEDLDFLFEVSLTRGLKTMEQDHEIKRSAILLQCYCINKVDVIVLFTESDLLNILLSLNNEFQYLQFFKF